MQEQVTEWLQRVQKDLGFWDSSSATASRTASRDACSTTLPAGASASPRPNPFDSSVDEGCTSAEPSAASVIGGVAWIDGTALPPLQSLACILQEALDRTLINANSVPPGVRVFGGCSETSATSSFRFAVSSEVGRMPAIAECLRAEAACRGAERLLPALVTLLEERAPACGHCRVRLELDEALREGQATTPRAYAAQKPRTSHSPAKWVSSWQAGSPREEMPEGPPSPTAQNLERDPELRARVMPNAIPLASAAGKRLTGTRR
mmetsp:Transcript_72066/g.166977  ORF Transcript_72066/g.166977 Transcript_72066/m.166977 type:complete len:264 (+) Transcript_72066:50-841(+)|eukprot:CAMPEP_0171065942 /NCGR_PEP_ID=MMETSP0766_2-20121228/7137_1 /TAXON_ID=439317 /ORGANISM="Gambierdiscus australes, Strain CAWD 149" /LENGTH=263 /DNA_ID=CAMNT_0011522083 /DNA_START=37 /DNA_END=828 /DNA_ORIENTATION=+